MNALRDSIIAHRLPSVIIRLVATRVAVSLPTSAGGRVIHLANGSITELQQLLIVQNVPVM